MAADVRTLGGAWNFRDVADTVPALRPGRLFRSSDLSGLDDDGRSTLRRLGITDIADLRSSREVDRRGPGRVPPGVDVHRLPFADLTAARNAQDGAAPHEHALLRMLTDMPDQESVSDTVSRYMVDEYRRFPILSGAQRAVRQVFSLLAAGRPVLAHCFAGKDRTGFVVAIVLETIGVDAASILTDYLHSNAAAAQLRSQILQTIQDRSDPAPALESFTRAGLAGRLSDEVLGVRRQYLAAAREAIDETYGSLAHYLRDCGVPAADADRLRSALLV